MNSRLETSLFASFSSLIANYSVVSLLPGEHKKSHSFLMKRISHSLQTVVIWVYYILHGQLSATFCFGILPCNHKMIHVPKPHLHQDQVQIHHLQVRILCSSSLFDFFLPRMTFYEDSTICNLCFFPSLTILIIFTCLRAKVVTADPVFIIFAFLLSHTLHLL